MRICFVSREVAGIRGGGIGTYVSEAAKALSARGHEVWLLIADPGPDLRPALQKLEGFHRIVEIPQVDWYDGRNDPDREEAQSLYFANPHYGHALLVHRKLQELDVRFDYVEFADYEAEGLVAIREQRFFRSYGDTLLGLKIHSPMWECYFYDDQWHRATVETRHQCLHEEELIRRWPYVTAASANYRDAVCERLRVDSDRIPVIHYPMSPGASDLAPPAPRRRLEDLRFLYFGRIEPRKGVLELITAFRQLPGLQLDLVGGDADTPLGESLTESLQRDLPDHIRLHGAVPRPQMLERLREADVVILPSRLENWPNTCIEAMTANRVVVGSRHGGMAEMIEHGRSGFLVDGRDPADIVRVIREDLGGALDRLDAIGRAAGERIRGLSDPDRFVDELEAWITAQRADWQAAGDRPAKTSASRLVSVVVPFYRDRDTIDETIDSAIAQDHPDLEILIVDDGSPLEDATEILARQAAKDPRVRVIRKPNGGLGTARNRGIAEARGEYLLFCDADNVLRPEYASTGLLVLDRHPDLMFVIPWAQFFEGDRRRQKRGIYNAVPIDRATSLVLNRFGDAGSMFRTALFRDYGIAYDEELTGIEDWCLWIDIHARGLEGAHLPRVLYDYRVRSDSMLSTQSLPILTELTGRLIARHFDARSEAERDVLMSVNEYWGRHFAWHQQTLAAGTRGVGDKASPMPMSLGPRKLRHALVDELARIARGIPGATRLATGFAHWILRRTGRPVSRS